MTVYELNAQQYKELCQAYLSNFWVDNENGTTSPSYHDLACADELVDPQIIYDYYDGVDFVEEDFSCNNVKTEIENILRSMCFGNSREWSEAMINKIYKTDTINDNCIEDYKPVTEDIVVSALMEIVFKGE